MPQQAHQHMLSTHFSLYELVRSEIAERQPFLLKKQLNPPPDILEHLQYLVDTALQPIRERFQYAMHVTSGYRSEALNRAIGGALNSAHAHGEAVDVVISDAFLTDPRAESWRANIQQQVQDITGKTLRKDVNANFYLYAFLCLHLNEFDIDEVGHEYGVTLGQPAWVHIAASQKHNKRLICVTGSYVPRDQRHPDLATALSFGV